MRQRCGLGRLAGHRRYRRLARRPWTPRLIAIGIAPAVTPCAAPRRRSPAPTPLRWSCRRRRRDWSWWRPASRAGPHVLERALDALGPSLRHRRHVRIGTRGQPSMALRALVLSTERYKATYLSTITSELNRSRTEARIAERSRVPTRSTASTASSAFATTKPVLA